MNTPQKSDSSKVFLSAAADVRHIVFVLFNDDRGRMSDLYELSFVNPEKNIVNLYNRFRPLNIIVPISEQITLIHNPAFDDLKNDMTEFERLHTKIIDWKDCSSYFTPTMYMLDIVKNYSREKVI